PANSGRDLPEEYITIASENPIAHLTVMIIHTPSEWSAYTLQLTTFSSLFYSRRFVHNVRMSVRTVRTYIRKLRICIRKARTEIYSGREQVYSLLHTILFYEFNLKN
ncbi:hypothetical protein, partial [Bacteroides heparinolyticus]|uniref:hypothetical protein n=1 Tax=Prevotella heparinolytica TaxID=28113 RepID=UPI0035A17DD6